MFELTYRNKKVTELTDIQSQKVHTGGTKFAKKNKHTCTTIRDTRVVPFIFNSTKRKNAQKLETSSVLVYNTYNYIHNKINFKILVRCIKVKTLKTKYTAFRFELWFLRKYCVVIFYYIITNSKDQ